MWMLQIEYVSFKRDLNNVLIFAENESMRVGDVSCTILVQYENRFLFGFYFRSFKRKTVWSNERSTSERSPSPLGRFVVVLGWEGLCLPAPVVRCIFHKAQPRPPIAVNPLFRAVCEGGDRHTHIHTLPKSQWSGPNHTIITVISSITSPWWKRHTSISSEVSVLMGNIVFKALRMIDAPVSKAVDSDFMHSTQHRWPQDTN